MLHRMNWDSNNFFSLVHRSKDSASYIQVWLIYGNHCNGDDLCQRPLENLSFPVPWGRSFFKDIASTCPHVSLPLPQSHFHKISAKPSLKNKNEIRYQSKVLNVKFLSTSWHLISFLAEVLQGDIEFLLGAISLKKLWFLTSCRSNWTNDL